MTTDIIDADHRALAVRDEIQPPANVSLFSGDPADVISQAVKVADALKAVVQSKGLVKKIQGREFIEVAGWQTLGAMTRVTPFCEWTRETSDGWEARVVIRNAQGMDIGAAEAQCTRSEKTWNNRDGYALRSMAQTRATSKALRSVLGFIVVLAGYKDTPAEEIPEDEPRAKQTAPPAANDEAKRKTGLSAVHALKAERHMSDSLYRELMYELFGADCLDGTNPTSAKLTYPQLRELYGAINTRTKPKEAASA